MILINAFMGIISIYLAPQIILYNKYPNVRYSLLLVYGFILSLTGVWALFLLIFYFHVPGIYTTSLSYILTGLSLFLILWKPLQRRVYSSLLLYFLAIIILLPLLYNLGSGFSALDAASSWNRWAIELFDNVYKPIDAAYPILFPALWSIVYKVQNTHEIWWTAQITLFITPIVLLSLLFFLYRESGDASYAWMAVFVYPYLLSPQAINGNMDMPVMFMGLLSLISLYAAEQSRDTKNHSCFTYASLLLAGLASITKQAGMVFFFFTIIYIILNYKTYSHKKRLFFFIILSLIYLVTFLMLYYANCYASATHNLNHLEHLSARASGGGFGPNYLQILFHRFWLVPDTVPLFEPLLAPFNLKIITPWFILFGYLLFIFRDLRKYNSVSFLSGIFFVLGVIIWARYFSYDFRNSLWIRAFFIIFVSININYVINKYKHNPYIVKALFVFVLLGIFYSLFLLGNGYAYQKQKEGQINVGKKPELAKYAASLLKDKKDCCKIYTNELALPYNYYVKAFQDKGQFEAMGRDYKFQDFSYLDHNCSDGSYVIFRDTSTQMEEWWKVQKLLADHLIREIKPLVYYVPPRLKIPAGYFDLHAHKVDVRMSDQSGNDVEYFMEAFLRRKDRIVIQGWGYIRDISNLYTKRYMVFKNKDNEYVFPMSTLYRSNVAEYYKDKRYENSGFLGIINTKELPAGTYHIYLLIIDKQGKQHIAKTKKTINIQ